MNSLKSKSGLSFENLLVAIGKCRTHSDCCRVNGWRESSELFEIINHMESVELKRQINERDSELALMAAHL